MSYVGCYFYFENGYHCFSPFCVDCAGFYLCDHFWSFCYLEISFLISNFVQHCGNLKKRCSDTIPPCSGTSPSYLKNNNGSGFHNIKLIQNKRQFPNLKKLLTKAEFGEVLSHMFNCSDKRYECCNYLLINDHYTFTNVQITFKSKNRFTCDSFNLIYVVIYDTFTEEYIGET